jgi:hypothetical protein
MTIIWHDHHIIPKHRGGTDDPSNIIRLSVDQHAQAHQIEYNLYGYEYDRLAWKALLGQLSPPEIARQAIIEGIKNGQKRGPDKIPRGPHKNPRKPEKVPRGPYKNYSEILESVKKYNYAKVGRIFNLSRERVRQIVVKWG